MSHKKLISIVVPAYNEAPNLRPLYAEVTKHTVQLPYDFEIIFVNDGSSDNTNEILYDLADAHEDVHIVQLSRNFGKEAAMTAGLHRAKGEAALIIDADLQMPPRLIGEFLKKWENGDEVVVGVFATRSMSFAHRIGSKWFYRIMQTIGHTKITPHATDFRLLDRQVIDEFNRMTEHNRNTRGLIDWLGFRRSYVYFKQEERRHGQPTYTYRKLASLAMNSFIGYSLMPLKLAGYLGAFILAISAPVGILLYIERYILQDPLHLGINSTTMLALLNVFLIGLVLACMGLVSLYIAHIHAEVTNRPLYVTRQRPRMRRKRQLANTNEEMAHATESVQQEAMQDEQLERRRRARIAKLKEATDA